MTSSTSSPDTGAARGAILARLRQSAPSNGILAYIARLLPPIGVVVGAYIFWAGADDPGGKFQGATVVAAMWLSARAERGIG